MLACSVEDGMYWLLLGRMASGVSENLLLSVLIWPHTWDGLVLKLILCRESLQRVCFCCFWMLVFISVLWAWILLSMSGVGSKLRSAFRVCILCLMSWLKVGL